MDPKRRKLLKDALHQRIFTAQSQLLVQTREKLDLGITTPSITPAMLEDSSPEELERRLFYKLEELRVRNGKHSTINGAGDQGYEMFTAPQRRVYSTLFTEHLLHTHTENPEELNISRIILTDAIDTYHYWGFRYMSEYLIKLYEEEDVSAQDMRLFWLENSYEQIQQYRHNFILAQKEDFFLD
ncbi:MAG: hypothetical protein AAGC85_17465 [Bacteroidota bacterium]